MSKLIDLTGQRFGRLTVISRAKNTPAGQAQWLSVCDCGKKAISTGEALRSGRTLSCGCFRWERLLQVNITHGESDSLLYHVWCDMKRRCQDKYSQDWKYYGSRGITVCDEWLNDFTAFHQWALENDYADGLSIDRIDVNKGYSPENCRWADAVTQSRNRRNVCLVTYQGKAQALSAWSVEYGISYGVLYYRYTHGWPIERALTEPVKKKK